MQGAVLARFRPPTFGGWKIFVDVVVAAAAIIAVVKEKEYIEK